MLQAIIAAALIVAGVFLSQRAESSGLPIPSSFVVPLWTLLVLSGWFVFSQGVFGGAWSAFTSPQKIILKTEKTPFELFLNVVNSCITQVIGLAALSVVALSVGERSDLLEQILREFLRKLIPVIEALLS